MNLRKLKKLFETDPWKDYEVPRYYVSRQGHGPGTVFDAVERAGIRPIHMRLAAPIQLTSGDHLIGKGAKIVGQPGQSSVIEANGEDIHIIGLVITGDGASSAIRMSPEMFAEFAYNHLGRP